MNFNLMYRPAHSLAQIQLNPGEAVVAEAGAMVGMSTNVQMQTQSGGIMTGLKRLFSGESFFRNTFTAQGAPGEVLVAQPLCGDMAVLEMTPQGYFLQNSAFIASTPNVDIQTKMGGFRGFFSGAGVFVIKAVSQGPGQLLIGAFGGVQQLQCDGSLMIDTGHLVAWDATLEYKIGKATKGWISSLFFSGEGLVCNFTGQGRIWIQTRNPGEYGRSVGPMLPHRSG